MKRFLLGAGVGLFLGWLTVPFLKASYEVNQSDHTTRSQVDDDDLRSAHAYKWYLQQLLSEMRQANQHLQEIEANTKAVREKLKA
jgi:hypothetical protein